MSVALVTPETAGLIIIKAQAIVERPLTEMEQAFIEYAVDQIRLGLVEVN